MAGGLIGALRVTLGIDAARFESGAREVERRAQLLERRMERLGSSMRSVGMAMSLGVTLPLVLFGRHAYQAASDAVELEAAFGETFGRMTRSMQEWAVTTGDAMSRSTQEIMRGANAFGLYFNQAASTRQEAARMSQQFTVLAQDLASFHNTGVDEALLALRSGLSGETEPLRRFGVFLNEAAVQQEALAMGMQTVNGRLTDQQKIMARASIIMRATATAQGDVLRTADSAANRMRAANAAWEEMSVEIGSKLLPLLAPFVEALTRVLQAFTSLPDGVQQFILVVGILGAALGPLLIVMGAIVSASGFMMGAFARLAVGTGALAGAMGVLRIAMGFLLGPWGIAIGVIATALYYLAGSSREAAIASQVHREALEAATAAEEEAEGITRELATATGRLREELIAEARAKRDSAAAALQLARADLIAARAAMVRVQAENERAVSIASRTTTGAGSGYDPLVGTLSRGDRARDQAQANFDASQQRVAAWTRGLARLDAAIAAPPPAAAPVGAPRGSGGGGGGGPSPQELAERRETLRLENALAVAQAAGDIDRERSLQRQIALRDRIKDYREAGLNADLAQAAALRDIEALEDARQVLNERNIAIQEEELDLVLARLRSDYTHIQQLEHSEELRRRIAMWQERGLDLANATRRAEEDMVRISEARLQVQRQQNEEAERDRELSLARLRADSERTVRGLERRNELERRWRELAERNNWTEERAREEAELQLGQEDRARLQGEFRTTFRDGIRAALDGDLRSFMRDWWADRLSRALEDALNNIADMLFNLFQQAFGQGAGALKGGGGGGGFLSALGAAFGLGGGRGTALASGSTGVGLKAGIPGFSTTGAFKVGGSGGVDSQLVRFRASPGEMVHVTRGSLSNPPAAILVRVVKGEMFDAHVERVAAPLADSAAARGAVGGVALSQRHQAKRDKGRLA